jgi:N-acyl-L-homoserine lactone synthetase
MLNVSGWLSSSYRAFRHFLTLESRLDSIDAHVTEMEKILIAHMTEMEKILIAHMTEMEKILIAAHQRLDVLITQTRAHDQSILNLRGFIAEETDRLDQYVNYHAKSLKRLLERNTKEQ